MTARPASSRCEAASRLAAIGEPGLVQGFALAGVRVFAVEDANAARAAWRELEPDVGIVILTAAAQRALDAELSRSQAPLSVVMPA